MAIYIDDRELVAAHQAGDGEAFDELVREHRRSLLSHAKNKLHCDAASEDALQETLVRAYSIRDDMLPTLFANQMRNPYFLTGTS